MTTEENSKYDPIETIDDLKAIVPPGFKMVFGGTDASTGKTHPGVHYDLDKGSDTTLSVIPAGGRLELAVLGSKGPVRVLGQYEYGVAYMLIMQLARLMPDADPVQELCEAFTKATGFLCSAGEDLDGQVIIYTGVKLTPEGHLMDLESEEVYL